MKATDFKREHFANGKSFAQSDFDGYIHASEKLAKTMYTRYLPCLGGGVLVSLLFSQGVGGFIGNMMAVLCIFAGLIVGGVFNVKAGKAVKEYAAKLGVTNADVAVARQHVKNGTVAAFLQFFLFGILVPAIILFALNYFTGAVTTPPTPFVGFLVNAFIMLALFNLARGVNLLIGIVSLAFGHTLDILSDCLLLAGLAMSAELAYNLPETPVWMRVIVCVGSLLVLLIGAGMFQHLSDQGEVTKTKIMFQNVEGTPGMIFFRFLVKEMILPLLLVSIFWIFKINMPEWLNKTFWILGFFWAWNILMTMWNCISLRYKASKRRRGNGKFAGFMAALHLFWGLPVCVIFLHWLFGWFPMKTWVIVILGVWGLLTLILAAMSTRSDTGVL